MKLIYMVLISALFFSSCVMREFNPVFESSKVAVSYPSGSTISRIGDKFYLMGDDSAEILVLDKHMEETERIPVFTRGEEMRLPKESKADIESSVVIAIKDKPAVLFLGSGSLSPHRDSSFLLNPELKEVDRIDSRAFFDELRREVRDLNIEAAALLSEELLLGLRANTSNPDNYIAIAGIKEGSVTFKRKILIRTSLRNAGISGMDYHQEEDLLFFTFSSEDTSNAYDDGKIGESYLGFLPNAREALQQQELVVERIVQLSSLSPEFLDQKIESVSIMNEPRKLMLVADDDKGNSKIFTVRY